MGPQPRSGRQVQPSHITQVFFNVLRVHNKSSAVPGYRYILAYIACPGLICICIYMYVCMYICMYVCTYVCMYVYMYICIYVCRLDEGVVGRGIGFPDCGLLAKYSAAKLNRSQLNVCTVYRTVYSFPPFFS
jgi:hypothetical protein